MVKSQHLPAVLTPLLLSVQQKPRRSHHPEDVMKIDQWIILVLVIGGRDYITP